MNHSIIPPRTKTPEPVHPPMIYVKEPLVGYKQITRDLKKKDH
jgi:hypothetical protein